MDEHWHQTCRECERLLQLRRVAVCAKDLFFARSFAQRQRRRCKQAFGFAESGDLGPGRQCSCASDGSRFESWKENPMTEWRSRYRGYGVMVYWHVETNAVCIYSQTKSFSNSEVAAMIEGLSAMTPRCE